LHRGNFERTQTLKRLEGTLPQGWTDHVARPSESAAKEPCWAEKFL